MSFRLKTIIGIALIEGSLLLFLVWSGVDYLMQSNQDELAIRAQTTSESFANLTRDAVLSTDLARLESVARRAMQSSDMVYVRFRDAENVLVEAGDEQALARPFTQDSRLDDASDGVFDVGVNITEGGDVYGRVELGLSVARATGLIKAARQHLFSIAAIEMFLVALFSYVLGTYLTRGLDGLTQAARAIAGGALGARVEVKGRDELAVAGKAFNTMSLRLAESQRTMQRSVHESERLAVKLSESEQRLSTILATAVDGFVIINEGGIIDDINPAGAALFGYEVDELRGRSVSSLMPEHHGIKHDECLNEFQKTGVASIIGVAREVTGMRKDLSTFPLDLAVSEIQTGGECMYVGLVRDITGKKRIEHEARKNAAIKAALVEANLDALVTIGMDDCIVEFSPVAEQMFGYRREEVLGKSMPELLIPPDMRQQHKQGMHHYSVTGNGPVLGQRIEVEAMRSNGELFPVELAIQPIGIDGEVLFTAFIRDISSRKEAETELRDARHRAEAASEAKTRFLAHMSHEIRSPLNAVLGSVGLLLDDELSKEQRLYAQTAQTSGKTLLSLINNILDFSKIEAGQLQLEQLPFSLADLLSDTADLVAFRAHDKPVQTAVAVEPGIGDELVGDPGRMRQILTNLMDNAFKFTEQGAVVLLVNEIARNEGSVTLRFMVQDTGIGIPEDAQAELFEEFHQVDSSDSTRYGGTGLGLSICQQLCTAMGGSIGLDSEPGRGSRFWVDVPFSRDAGTGGNDTPDVCSASQQRVMTQQVLIVGLHPLVRQAMQLHCKTGVRCADMVDSVADALARMTVETDAVLVNGTLPSIDLARLSRQARELGVRHLILINPRVTADAVDRVCDGQYDDLLVMPLLVCRMVELLRAGPQGVTGVPEADQPVAATPAFQNERPDTGHTAQPCGHILLAEDSPANQLVAKAMLSKAGYQVDIVENGQQAVDAFTRGDHDLILMDLRMPEMNGLEATAAIRACENGKSIPIIAMTANARKEDVDRCRVAGMDGFVAKPVDKQKLFETLQQYLPCPQSAAVTCNEPSQAVDVAHGVELDDSGALLDDAAICQLAEDTSAELVPNMVSLFIEEIVSRAGRVSEGLNSLPLESLEDEAHTLKSCAGTFGAIRLQGLARAMEAACRQGNRNSAENLGSQIPEILAQTLQAYRDRFGFLTEPSELKPAIRLQR
jgi:PAS domain S-box-containing protein